MRQLYLLLAQAATIIILTGGGAFAEEMSTMDYGTRSIASDSAVEALLGPITGLPLDGKDSETALSGETRVVQSTESQVAFIASGINRRRAWLTEILVPDIGRLIYADEQHRDDVPSKEFPKRFEVYIDSATGLFLEARAVFEGEHEWLFPEPTESEAVEQLAQFSELYHGLPDVAPGISMIDAMKVCKSRPLSAKEMTISYVLYSFQGSEPIPCWVLLFRGLPPIRAAYGFDEITPSHTTERMVVDAMTGERLFTINMPTPGRDENGNSYYPTIEEFEKDQKQVPNVDDD